MRELDAGLATWRELDAGVATWRAEGTSLWRTERSSLVAIGDHPDPWVVTCGRHAPVRCRRTGVAAEAVAIVGAGARLLHLLREEVLLIHLIGVVQQMLDAGGDVRELRVELGALGDLRAAGGA